MTVKEYLNKKLLEDKIDGLVSPFGECFCHASGGLFMNCGEVNPDCYLGKIQKCSSCSKANILDCKTDKFSYGAEGIDSCILAIKPHKDIVTYLKEKLVGDGHEGLVCREIECGCKLEDEFPCGEISTECEIGFLQECKECVEEGCEYRNVGDSYCIKAKNIKEKTSDK